MTKGKCSTINHGNCSAAAASDHGQAFSSCPLVPVRASREPAGCVALRPRSHRMQLGLSILKWPLGPTGSVRSTRSWEGGQVHPAPLPLHCFWAWTSEMALSARSTSCRKSASPGQGCPAEGSASVSSACVPAERHGHVSHTNAKPQACCKCRGIVISHGGLID